MMVAAIRGEVPEWLNGPVLKTGEGYTSVGSNPTLSDRLRLWLEQGLDLFPE